ncbi:MAG TPA: MATE family efflux transporter [Gemmatimonadales bacterium]|nr:MATE family efflux transporter [Gemmatimonadales bacterium]
MSDRPAAPSRGGVLPTRGELGPLLRLALPVVVVQVGLMLMGVVDSIMAGRLSATALGAVALGNVYFFAIAIFGMGVLMALDPLVAQAVGAGDEPAIARAVQRGLLLALALSLPSSVLLLFAQPALRALAQPADLAASAAVYSRYLVPGVAPFFAFIVLRQTLQARELMRPIVLTILGANLANVALNWTLIYGKLGAPALGVAGAALATTGSRWIMAVALLALGWGELHAHLVPLRREITQWEPLRRMLAIGYPIGLQHLMEYGVFGTVALLMGRLGTVPIAAHQVAINLASLTFMVPLGIGAAATVLVGQAVGRGDMRGARRAARAGLASGVAFMTTMAVVMLLAPTPLARIYSREAAVVALAATLLPIAGAFQIFDGLQVVSLGILRGLADTRAPFLIALLGFWLFGFPVSLALGFRTPLGPAGLWWGLVVGLATVAVLLLARVRSRLRLDVRRVVVDGVPEIA